MTEARFLELVNLYLDEELSDQNLAELRAELARSPQRKQDFRQRCRLHQAMRLAMAPSLAPSDREVTWPGHRLLSSWGGAGALAACLLLGLVLIYPNLSDTEIDESPLASVDGEGRGVSGENLLDSIGSAELRRYAAIREQRSVNPRASLAAQLRLMGLRPELTPERKQLRPVSMAASKMPKPQERNAALLDEVQKLSPIPEYRILKTEPLPAESASLWPGGFQSSLASFRY